MVIKCALGRAGIFDDRINPHGLIAIFVHFQKSGIQNARPGSVTVSFFCCIQGKSLSFDRSQAFITGFLTGRGNLFLDKQTGWSVNLCKYQNLIINANRSRREVMTASQLTPARELDTTGLNCPLPILKTRKELKSMNTGDVLKMTSSDVGSLKDIEAFCNQTGHGLLSTAQEGNSYVYHIRKN